jgi:orotidine-5'-phosphate decarboxylase
MDNIQLFEQIQHKKSFLCVGLDTDIQRIPHHLLEYQYQIFEFNRQIIDATANYTIAYKTNIAFYEVLGASGWINLEMTVNYIRAHYPEIFIIADAKRGDIGNTSKYYAKTFFETLNFDAITVSPYMGKDSVSPFLGFQDKWVILLALTSNSGSNDFQQIIDKKSNSRLFENIIRVSAGWSSKNNMMYVIGATHAEMLAGVRRIIPEHFLLIPGIGAQGGSLNDVAKYGFNKNCGLIVNSSRAIIYADGTVDFAKAAGIEAYKVQQEMEKLLKEYGLTTNN